MFSFAIAATTLSICSEASGLVDSDKRTVVVTGATGQSGSLFYNRLKAEGLWNVRALVRNATKAKALLKCSVCDESEGIFVGDLTSPPSLKNVMKGADALAIFTS